MYWDCSWRNLSLLNYLLITIKPLCWPSTLGEFWPPIPPKSTFVNSTTEIIPFPLIFDCTLCMPPRRTFVVIKHWDRLILWRDIQKTLKPEIRICAVKFVDYCPWGSISMGTPRYTFSVQTTWFGMFRVGAEKSKTNKWKKNHAIPYIYLTISLICRDATPFWLHQIGQVSDLDNRIT